MGCRKDDSNLKFVTQALFARRLGVSRAAVGKAVRTGRIELSKRKDKRGNFLINWETQSLAYYANTDHSKNTSKAPSKQAKKIKPYTPPKKKTVKEKPLTKKEEKEVEKEIRKLTAKGGKFEEFIPDIPDIPDAELKDGIPENVKKRLIKSKAIIPEIGSVAYNSNRKLAADADRSELKYATELGQVIPKDVAIMLAGSIMVSIKEALLALPSRSVGLIEATIKTKVEKWKSGEEDLLYNAILKILDASVKEILEDASKGIKDLPKDVEAYFGGK